MTRRNTVHNQHDFYDFLLPGHKADWFFEGNRIVIPAHRFNLSPLIHFTRYLDSRDTIHPIASPLWLTKAGTVPTRSFFITRLRLFFQNNISGHSMQAGGATSLAEHGVSPAIIQASGRWVEEPHLASRISPHSLRYFFPPSLIHSLFPSLSFFLLLPFFRLHFLQTSSYRLFFRLITKKKKKKDFCSSTSLRNKGFSEA